MGHSEDRWSRGAYSRVSQIPLLTVRGAIVAGSFAGVLYGINFALQLLVGVFKMTGASGFISGFTVPFFLVIACRMNRQWGTATMIWTIYSALAIPTALMGTPGAYKLLVGFVGGMAYDLAFCSLKCRSFAVYPALFAYVILLNLGFYAVYVWGLIPELAGGSMVKILITVSVVFVIEGLISSYFANRFFVSRVEPMLR